MDDNKTPYTENWNVMVDQAAPWKSTFEFGYNGSRSRNLVLGNSAQAQPNTVQQGAYFKPDPVTGITYCQTPYFVPTGCTPGGVPGSAAVDYRAYNYNGLSLLAHGSWANYNAMQLSWSKQAGRANLMFNYTWSKTLGFRDGETTNGTGANGSLTDPFNMGPNYGVLAYDRTQIFNASYIINLPSPIKGSSMGARVGKEVVNGWVISGITQMQSGTPIQPNAGGNLNMQISTQSTTNILGSPQGELMPYLVCNPKQGRDPGTYFNPACFAPPDKQLQNGPYMWPYIKGPGYFNSDLGVFKNFKITERQTLQFRVQAFNFLNHPLPDFTLDGTDLQLNFKCLNNGVQLAGCQPDPLDTSGNTSLVNTNPDTNGKPHYKVGRRVMEFALKYTF